MSFHLHRCVWVRETYRTASVGWEDEGDRMSSECGTEFSFLSQTRQDVRGFIVPAQGSACLGWPQWEGREIPCWKPAWVDLWSRYTLHAPDAHMHTHPHHAQQLHKPVFPLINGINRIMSSIICKKNILRCRTPHWQDYLVAENCVIMWNIPC